MTYSFKQFQKEYWSDDNKNYNYDFIDNLAPEQISDLKQELTQAPDEIFQKVMDILSDYASVENVPVSFIKDILQKDLMLAMEVFSNGIGDSCQREMLVDTFLKKIGVGSWPLYGSSEEYKESFAIQYKEAVEKFGFKLVIE